MAKLEGPLAELADMLEEKDQRIQELELELKSLKDPLLDRLLRPAEFATEFGLKRTWVESWIYQREKNGLEETGAVFQPHGKYKGSKIFVRVKRMCDWIEGRTGHRVSKVA